MSKKIVFYYSRTGNTRKVAKAIGEHFNCRVKEIKDKKKRAGFWGLISAGKDAFLKKDTEIEVEVFNLNNIDTIFMGSPVWAGGITPALKTFLKEYDLAGKKIIPFCTQGGKESSKFFKQVEELCPESDIIKTFHLSTKDVTRMNVELELRKTGLA